MPLRKGFARVRNRGDRPSPGRTRTSAGRPKDSSSRRFGAIASATNASSRVKACADRLASLRRCTHAQDGGVIQQREVDHDPIGIGRPDFAMAAQSRATPAPGTARRARCPAPGRHRRGRRSGSLRLKRLDGQIPARHRRWACRARRRGELLPRRPAWRSVPSPPRRRARSGSTAPARTRIALRGL